MTNQEDIAHSISQVRNKIEDAARETSKLPDNISLCAVSKTFPIGTIQAAIAAGQRVFGENRVQEAEVKWPNLKKEWPDIELHLIGPLQTNKVRKAVSLFDVIQTVDREKLARTLAKEMTISGRQLPCYVQVNTGGEPQKAGLTPSDVNSFVTLCREEIGLKIVGLMCIPPYGEEPSTHFALLQDMADQLKLPDLSMGMSADYPIAVQFGATVVRVGSAIFGARTPINVAEG
ncbi:MAG: YggS family pyridoxal phosphate-dependent enzyme [Pseudomonadota bacterium]|nr:YggS family pyridoxal phosphate-dependent enzyme [Pseudomonadota bacterium]